MWRHLRNIRKHPAVVRDPRSEEEKQRDYQGIGATMPVLQEDGQWDAYKPVYETQFLKYADTFACVTFSSANCLEFLHKRKYETDLNTSDRFIAILSGTKCNFGNWLQNVGNTWNNAGFLYEIEFPSPSQIMNCSEFYVPLTQEQKDLAKSRLQTYEISYRWITATDWAIKQALQFAPVQVVINDGSHAVTCYGYEGDKAKIYDTYLNYGDNCYLYDFSKISSAMQYDIILKNNDMKFLKTQSDPTVYLILEDRAFPILEPTTYYALSGKTDWSSVQIVDFNELTKYKIQDRLFTVGGLVKVLNN